MVNYMELIVRDPDICGGTPVIKGTRIPLHTVLASLAEGAGTGDILTDFPTLTEEAVRAVIAFAAVSAGEDLPNEKKSVPCNSISLRTGNTETYLDDKSQPTGLEP